MPIPEGVRVRDYRKALGRENRRYGNRLVKQEVPIHLHDAAYYTKLRAVWRSNRFLVLEYKPVQSPQGPVIRLTVQRTWCDDKGEWVDGITWDELQEIKAQAGYRDHTAIEIYPPEDDIVNVASMRHIWVLAPGQMFSFQWRKETNECQESLR